MSRSRMPQLSTMIMLKRIKWYGHIQRMEPGRLARSAFDWDPPDQYAHARRAPGGQRKTWMTVHETKYRSPDCRRKQQPGQRRPSTISSYSTSQNNQTNNSSCFVCICICICICCQPCLYFIFGIKVLKQ